MSMSYKIGNWVICEIVMDNDGEVLRWKEGMGKKIGEKKVLIIGCDKSTKDWIVLLDKKFALGVWDKWIVDSYLEQRGISSIWKGEYGYRIPEKYIVRKDNKDRCRVCRK